MFFFFFFNDTATTEIYTLSLHDALPISRALQGRRPRDCRPDRQPGGPAVRPDHQHHGPDHGQEGPGLCRDHAQARSEEHTSELQSHSDLVCRLLLEKKKKKKETKETVAT